MEIYDNKRRYPRKRIREIRKELKAGTHEQKPEEVIYMPPTNLLEPFLDYKIHGIDLSIKLSRDKLSSNIFINIDYSNNKERKMVSYKYQDYSSPIILSFSEKKQIFQMNLEADNFKNGLVLENLNTWIFKYKRTPYNIISGNELVDGGNPDSVASRREAVERSKGELYEDFFMRYIYNQNTISLNNVYFNNVYVQEPNEEQKRMTLHHVRNFFQKIYINGYVQFDIHPELDYEITLSYYNMFIDERNIRDSSKIYYSLLLPKYKKLDSTSRGDKFIIGFHNLVSGNRGNILKTIIILIISIVLLGAVSWLLKINLSYLALPGGILTFFKETMFVKESVFISFLCTILLITIQAWFIFLYYEIIVMGRKFTEKILQGV